MSHDAIGRREPAINLPGLVLASILALIAIHFVRGWLSLQDEAELLFGAGFIPARWSLAIGWADAEEVLRGAAEHGGSELGPVHEALARFIVGSGETRPFSILTYAVLHGSWMHVVLNCVWLAAFASPVVRRCGTGRAIVLALLTTIGAALAQWLVQPLSPQLMIGASGAVSGFMGAAALFVFARPSSFSAWPVDPGLQRTSVFELLRNRSALFFLGSWLGINLLVGLLSQPLGIAEGGIAWQAHIGGLVTGLLVFPWLDPVGRLDPAHHPPG